MTLTDGTHSSAHEPRHWPKILHTSKPYKSPQLWVGVTREQFRGVPYLDLLASGGWTKIRNLLPNGGNVSKWWSNYHGIESVKNKSPTKTNPSCLSLVDFYHFLSSLLYVTLDLPLAMPLVHFACLWPSVGESWVGFSQPCLQVLFRSLQSSLQLTLREFLGFFWGGCCECFEKGSRNTSEVFTTNGFFLLKVPPPQKKKNPQMILLSKN